MSICQEIESAVTRLGLTQDDIRLLPDIEARVLTEAMLARFTGGKDVRWWWEYFTLPHTEIRFDDGKGFSRIEALVLDKHERVWFVTEDDQLPMFPIYETTPATAQKVLGECYGFEYYLVGRDLSWLLCENHHNVMYAIGDIIRDRLAKVGDEQADPSLAEP